MLWYLLNIDAAEQYGKPQRVPLLITSKVIDLSIAFTCFIYNGRRTNAFLAVPIGQLCFESCRMPSMSTLLGQGDVQTFGTAFKCHFTIATSSTPLMAIQRGSI